MAAGREKDPSLVVAHCAVFLGSMLATERLRVSRPGLVQGCKAMAGVGLGELSALCAAGAIDFEAGLRLALARARWELARGLPEDTHERLLAMECLGNAHMSSGD